LIPTESSRPSSPRRAFHLRKDFPVLAWLGIRGGGRAASHEIAMRPPHERGFALTQLHQPQITLALLHADRTKILRVGRTSEFGRNCNRLSRRTTVSSEAVAPSFKKAGTRCAPSSFEPMQYGACFWQRRGSYLPPPGCQRHRRPLRTCAVFWPCDRGNGYPAARRICLEERYSEIFLRPDLGGCSIFPGGDVRCCIAI